ncbi:helix-turn-helix domain-containing protein [Aliifodinibius sp. S!AR15-10]|uniref:DUF6597 domain-containing transcriptional factor n=1 Tax=Aliifodinibius sp. S!AR15-10 TaxID=2950437 RepID=UPI00285BBA7C|nr:helix-turn-helix domain-containing protein [Aliifodinibius sp. S!AR15-10]MDR8390803.1 helix-turn-helix domain-containing protein [Aliifodinibius sp. S!AR15-10]
MSVQIQEFSPGKDLRPYVEFFWEGQFNLSGTTTLYQKVVPNGFVELVIHPSDSHCHLPIGDGWSSSPDYTIIGLYTRPYEVQFPHYVNVFGIRFKPEGIYNLFGIPASVFSEKYEDMELVLGREFKEYCERLRETPHVGQRLKLTTNFLLKKLEQNSAEITYLNRAAEMIRRSEGFNKIDDLPDKVYISQRQLEREFNKKIGITPKRYMRIARLNEVHRKLEEEQELELTKIAFDCGYADQAHFIRDFKSFMGVNPTLFTKNRHQFIVNSQSAKPYPIK